MQTDTGGRAGARTAPPAPHRSALLPPPAPHRPRARPPGSAPAPPPDTHRPEPPSGRPRGSLQVLGAPHSVQALPIPSVPPSCHPGFLQGAPAAVAPSHAGCHLPSECSHPTRGPPVPYGVTLLTHLTVLGLLIVLPIPSVCLTPCPSLSIMTWVPSSVPGCPLPSGCCRPCPPRSIPFQCLHLP